MACEEAFALFHAMRCPERELSSHQCVHRAFEYARDCPTTAGETPAEARLNLVLAAVLGWVASVIGRRVLADAHRALACRTRDSEEE